MPNDSPSIKEKTMKVKVNNKIYDGEKEFVMVILDDVDKKNIAEMPKELTNYCQFPGELSDEELNELIGEE
jgi:hypothetical protein